MPKDDFLDRDQIIANKVSIDFLKKDIENIIDTIDVLKSSLVKNSEELKECYYLTETNSKKLEELEENIFETVSKVEKSLTAALADYKKELHTFKKYFSEEQNQRRKNFSNYVLIFVTCLGFLLALLLKLKVF